MSSGASKIAQEELRRCLSKGFVRLPTTEEESTLLQTGQVFPSFVSGTAGKSRLVIDYKRANACLEPRTFRMDHLYDLAPERRHGDHLVKADLTYG